MKGGVLIRHRILKSLMNLWKNASRSHRQFARLNHSMKTRLLRFIRVPRLQPPKRADITQRAAKEKGSYTENNEKSFASVSLCEFSVGLCEIFFNLLWSPNRYLKIRLIGSIRVQCFSVPSPWFIRRRSHRRIARPSLLPPDHPEDRFRCLPRGREYSDTSCFQPIRRNSFERNHSQILALTP
jgi:hypothetical protein